MNCIVLVPFQNAISEACEVGLRALERLGFRIHRFRVGHDHQIAISQIASDVLLEGFEEMMWIGPNVSFHPDSIRFLSGHGAGIASAVCFHRFGLESDFHFPSGQVGITCGNGGSVVEAKSTSLSFLHVRSSVLRDLAETLPRIDGPKPWYPFFIANYHFVNGKYRYFSAAEAFCRLAIQRGVRVIVDTRIRVWTMDHKGYSWEESGRDPDLLHSVKIPVRIDPE